jgi:hypothetical protein
MREIMEKVKEGMGGEEDALPVLTMLSNGALIALSVGNIWSQFWDRTVTGCCNVWIIRSNCGKAAVWLAVHTTQASGMEAEAYLTSVWASQSLTFHIQGNWSIKSCCQGKLPEKWHGVNPEREELIAKSWCTSGFEKKTELKNEYQIKTSKTFIGRRSTMLREDQSHSWRLEEAIQDWVTPA